MSIIICCYIFIILICLVGIRKNEAINGLTKDATQAIRGVGMLLIVFSHAIENTINNTTYFFYVSAILGVSACFLVSGYGLFISMSKKENYLKGFLIQKFSRLLIPYFIFFIISIIVNLTTDNIVNFKDTILELITLQLDGLLLWYLKIQLLLYIFFYLSFKFIKNQNIAITVIFVLTLIYYVIALKCGLKPYWYNTCIFFALGILMAKTKDSILHLIKKCYIFIPSGIITIAIFIFIYLFGRMELEILIDNAYMLAFNVFLIGIFMNFNNSYFLNIMGKYSMEIYISHLLILKWNPFGLLNPNNGISYLLLLLETIAFSIPVYIVSNKINDNITKLVKKNKVWLC